MNSIDIIEKFELCTKTIHEELVTAFKSSAPQYTTVLR